jgi:hypothetical protein
MRRLSFFLAACIIAGIPATSRAQLSDKLRINGYASFEFEQRIGPVGRGDGHGSFDSDGLDLVFNFMPVQKVRVSTDITIEHGGSTGEQRGGINAQYAFAEYTINDWFRVRGGKDYSHFDLYNEFDAAKPAFLSVKVPYATVKPEKYGSDSRFYPISVSGIAILGSGALGGKPLDYIVQLSNGDQPIIPVAGSTVANNPFNVDDNNQKAYSGTVRYSPTSSLRVGASFYLDHPEEYDATFVDLKSQSSLGSYGTVIEWQPGQNGVELELVRGSTAPSTGVAVNRDALSFMVYRRFGPVTPYARYEHLDPNHSIDQDEASTRIGGINVQIGQGTFVKLEFDDFRSGLLNKRFKGVNYGEIKSSFAVAF